MHTIDVKPGDSFFSFHESGRLLFKILADGTVERGAACRWFDESSQIENVIRPGYLGIRKILPLKTDHPTPKPPELARHFIRLHTLPGHTVIDPFMGGGSTGVAAVKEGRKFVGIELEPQWFELSIKRISEAIKQPDMFIESPKLAPTEQLDLIGKAKS